MTKPFSLEELVARLRGPAAPRIGEPISETTTSLLVVGGLTLDERELRGEA